jgi:penicillin-binding protein 1A
VFAGNGYREAPVTLVAVTDAAGQLLLDRGAFHDGAGSAGAMLWRARRDVAERERPVISPQTAYLMTYTLHDVVEMGTGYGATELGFPVAGKTGTTTAYDGWFVGFTESLVTTVWVGSDINTRPLGRGETGGEVALPIWLSFMQAALAGRTQGSLTDNPPPGIEVVRIDRETGLLSAEGDPGIWLPFRAGSEPEEYAPSQDEREMRRMDRVEDEF